MIIKHQKKQKGFSARVIFLSIFTIFAVNCQTPAASQSSFLENLSSSNSPSTEIDGLRYNRVEGDLIPISNEPFEVTKLPNGFRIEASTFKTQLTGGLNGTTSEIDYSILTPFGNGSIRGGGSFSGTLEGKTGSFIMDGDGIWNENFEFEANWEVVPGSGSDGLEGLRGKGKTILSRSHCKPSDSPETCESKASYEFRYYFER